MLYLTRTDSLNEDFIGLVKYLDADLAAKDGKEHDFYKQFNKIDTIRYVMVAYANEKPVGCGAIKELDPLSMEVKRMYVAPAYRGQGIARAILQSLETWAKELCYQQCRLETGKRQQDAIRLYIGSGYKQIENYGQYIGIENSLCFEKDLT